MEISEFLKLLNKNKNASYKKFNYSYLYKNFKINELRNKLEKYESITNKLNKAQLCKKILSF